MANYGYHDSTSAMEMAYNIPSLDYDKDFALAENSANSVVLSNVTTPVDQPESLRIAIADIKDVYKNTSIQPLYRQNGLKGKKILLSLYDTARVTTDGVTVDYPVKCGVTVEFPVSANLSADDVNVVLIRAMAAFQDRNLVDVAHGRLSNAELLNKYMRGAVNPQDGKPIEAA